MSEKNMDQHTYEVTVPVVVTIVGGVVAGVKIDGGYPGFFSDAADTGGVWDVDDETWGGPAYALGLAWAQVKARIGS